MAAPDMAAVARRLATLLLALCAALAAAWPSAPAGAATLELREARSMVSIEGNASMGTSTLPYHWDGQHRAKAGSAVFEAYFALPGEPAVPYAVYFPRIGNAYEVWLNGSLLSRSGDLQRPDGADYAKAPRYFAVPPQMLQTDNLLRIAIRADGGRRAGVAAPLVGPEDEVYPVYQRAYRWRVAGSLVVCIISLLVGAVAVALWWTQPLASTRGAPLKRDPIYLFPALAELAWTLRVSDQLIEQPPLAWPLWGMLIGASYAAYLACATQFCHEVVGWRSARLRLVTLSVFPSGTLCVVWALGMGQPAVWTAWLGLASFGFLAYGLYLSWQALHHRTLEHGLLALAVVANVVAGVRDWLAVRLGGDFAGEGTWIRFAAMLFGLTLGYIMVTRFRAASAQARDLMTTLADRVAQKEGELAASYQQLEVLAREQARTAERTRILRDMHDGVGSHISSAIRQLQSGRASNQELLFTLRDSLDQLKLSIDSMNLPPGDVTALLASMRYRLEPRFAASDISLQWDVDLLPELPRLDANAMRQLQYMLFEALSNVLQHAQAKVLRVEAHAELPAVAGGAQAVRVRVVDDGRGFDVQAARRQGLASMQERAAAIGAQLRISSQPGETAVEIRLG